MFDDLGLVLKNLLLPIFCKECGIRLLTEENGFFCPECWELSPRIRRPFCPMCAKPHQGAVGFGTRSNFLCAECRARGPRTFDRAYGAAVYDGAIGEAVKLLKFHGKQRLARPLGEVMAEFAREEMECEAYDCVVPVPLHRVRHRERGFNQSYLLALEVLSAFPNAELDESLLRVRPTRVQSRIKDPEERRANITGAFGVEGDNLAGKSVVLIDDVVTTGETTAECARVLRRADVAHITIFATTIAIPRLMDAEF